MPISFDHPVARGMVTPPRFFFFATQRAHSFWRHLFPFISVKQCIITLSLTAAVVIVCSVVVPESVDLRVRLFIFIYFIVTLIRELREQLPGKITVATSRGSARQLIPDLRQAILELGYTDTTPSAKSDQLRFCPISDAELWLYSSKQDIELSIADENIIEVFGAIAKLKQVIIKLNWKLEK